MKIIVTVCFLLFFSITTYSQVGVNTKDPTESLDIDGTLRIRQSQRLTTNTEPWLLVSSEDGVVKQIPSNLFSAVTATVQTKVVFNDTIKIDIPNGFTNFQLDFNSTNTCSRTLFASFRYSGNENIFLGASARGSSSASDATVTTDKVGLSEVSYGTGVKVVWKNINATCSTVASAGTNLYDFWIRRTSPTTISFVWGGQVLLLVIQVL